MGEGAAEGWVVFAGRVGDIAIALLILVASLWLAFRKFKRAWEMADPDHETRKKIADYRNRQAKDG